MISTQYLVRHAGLTSSNSLLPEEVRPCLTKYWIGKYTTSLNQTAQPALLHCPFYTKFTFVYLSGYNTINIDFGFCVIFRQQRVEPFCSLSNQLWKMDDQEDKISLGKMTLFLRTVSHLMYGLMTSISVVYVHKLITVN